MDLYAVLDNNSTYNTCKFCTDANWYRVCNKKCTEWIQNDIENYKVKGIDIYSTNILLESQTLMFEKINKFEKQNNKCSGNSILIFIFMFSEKL